METDALQDFRCFAGISEAWELVRTGLVVVRGETYRLELWHSYSNPDIAYFVTVYTQEGGVWRRIHDAGFPMAPNADQAMRTAMAFLAERKSA